MHRVVQVPIVPFALADQQRKRTALLNAGREAWEQHLSDVLAARDALNERLRALGDEFDDRPVIGPWEFSAAGQRDALRAMLRALDDGPIDPVECRGGGSGTLASIQPFDRLPGIQETERRIAEFREREEEAAQAVADGAQEYPYRLRYLTREVTQRSGPAYGKFFLDDGANDDGTRRLRRLKPGETVMLTRQRAQSAGLVIEEVPPPGKAQKAQKAP